MMDKLAHDAYSQGAYDALQQMDIPDNIKIAAAQELTKTASLKAIGSSIVSGLGKARRGIFGKNIDKGLTPGSRSKYLKVDGIENNSFLKEQLKKDQIRAGLGALGLTGAVYAPRALGAFDEDEPVVVPEPEPAPKPELGMMDQIGEYGSNFLERARKGELSNAEIAALAGTGVLGAGGLAYGLS